jgi:hypothetical protein
MLSKKSQSKQQQQKLQVQQIQQSTQENPQHNNMQQPFQQSGGAFHNQIPTQFQQQSFQVQQQHHQMQSQQHYAGLNMHGQNQHHHMPSHGMQNQSLHQQQSYSNQQATPVGNNLYSGVYGQSQHNPQQFNSHSYNMMNNSQMMFNGNQSTSNMNYPGPGGMQNMFAGQQNGQTASQLTQQSHQHVMPPSMQYQHSTMHQASPGQQTPSPLTSQDIIHSASSNTAASGPSMKQTKARQPRKSKSTEKKVSGVPSLGDSPNDAVSAEIGQESIAPVNGSETGNVTAQEDDDGTERPVLNEKEFNLTDGRIVQSEEVDPDSLMDEEEKARYFARRALGESSSVVEMDPSEPTRFNMVNIFDLERLMQRLNNRLGSRTKIHDNAKRLLSHAIQQHLCTVLESAIICARSRYQLSVSRHYRAMSDHFEAGNPVTKNQLSVFAFRWGPDSKTQLNREEKKASYLVAKFNGKDRLKLIENMKDLLAKRAMSGNKRRAEENLDMSWKTAEDSAAKEGNLSWDQLAALHFKVQTFQPYIRDASALKAISSHLETSDVPPLSLSDMNDSTFSIFTGSTIEVVAKDLHMVLRDARRLSGERIISRSFARK